MPHNFYFGKNADVVTGSANFASLIATGFASYGLTSAQSTAFGTLNTSLQSAYLAAVEPTTRTAVTTPLFTSSRQVWPSQDSASDWLGNDSLPPACFWPFSPS